MSLVLIFAWFLLLPAVLSWALCPVCARIARRTGFLDQPGERKVHVEPKPYLGGVAIFVAFNAVLLAHLGAALLAPTNGPAFLQPALDLVAENRAGIERRLPQLWAFLGGGLLIHLIGLYDDRKGMQPKVKLLGIILAALLLAASGIRLSAFVDEWWVYVPISAFWVVLLTNSFNLLDNMDGLSAGVASICLAFFAYVTWRMGQLFVPITIVILIGALLGFLKHNFYPSKIFMGDAGSLFIGYAISGLTMLSTFYTRDGTMPIAAVFAPLVIMAVPLFDTTSVIVIRLKNQKPIFQGDKNHFSHRLVALGMNHRNAVLFIYLVTIMTGLSAVLLTLVRPDAPEGAAVLGIQVFIVFLIIALLEWQSRHLVKRAKPEPPGGK